MKKFIIIILFLLITATAFTQVSIGLGAELNMNSRDNFAGGGVFHFDYGFAEKFAAGLTFTASNNFDNITVLEPAALFRWYVLGKNYVGLFIQADAI